MEAAEVAVLCKALGDENRLKIITLLTNGEKCACELLERFQITQPTLSHHMKILSDCQLVKSRKEGKWTYYEINCCRFKEFKQYFEAIQCWKDKVAGETQSCKGITAEETQCCKDLSAEETQHTNDKPAEEIQCCCHSQTETMQE